jgi:hypothetical protein
MNRNRRGLTRKNAVVLMGLLTMLLLIGAGWFRSSMRRSEELRRREACVRNLERLGKGIALYQAGYSEKFPALADPEPKPKATPMGAGNDRE